MVEKPSKQQILNTLKCLVADYMQYHGEPWFSHLCHARGYLEVDLQYEESENKKREKKSNNLRDL